MTLGCKVNVLYCDFNNLWIFLNIIGVQGSYRFHPLILVEKPTQVSSTEINEKFMQVWTYVATHQNVYTCNYLPKMNILRYFVANHSAIMISCTYLSVCLSVSSYVYWWCLKSSLYTDAWACLIKPHSRIITPTTTHPTSAYLIAVVEIGNHLVLPYIQNTKTAACRRGWKM